MEKLLGIEYTDSESAASDEDAEEIKGECSAPSNLARPGVPSFSNTLMDGPAANHIMDSEEDTSSSSDEANEGLTESEPGAFALSNPFSSGSIVREMESVFAIPIRESGHQESSLLERHVKMTPRHRSQAVINGKKICWNYRKGKCRFGSKCTFAHDSDIVQKGGESGNHSSLSNQGASNSDLPAPPKRFKK